MGVFQFWGKEGDNRGKIKLRRQDMEQRRAQKRAALLREIENWVDELLDWEEATPSPSLSQIEDEILLLRKRIGQQAAQLLLAEQERNSPVPEPECPKCGRGTRFKGRKAVQVESLIGSLSLKRGYYWCEECRAGFFPSGSAASDANAGLE
jgi:hypothetical protein